MSTSFRPYQSDWPVLLPIDLHERLPQGYLSHFISDAIDEQILSVFYIHCEGDGRRNRPYGLRMMLKVLLYAAEVFASRKIAHRLREDVAFRHRHPNAERSGFQWPSTAESRY